MFTFLRKIRKTLIESGATKRYILYAVGEIMLVMIGILLALQVNNWNEDRNNRTKELRLLKELRSNLTVNQEHLREQIDLDNVYFNSCKIVVQHLDRKRPYHDSLALHLGLAQYSADIVLTTSAYEAIKSRGFDIIRNDSLRSAIIDLFDTNYSFMVRNTLGLEDQFWPSVALPLSVKHLRELSEDYSSVAMIPIDYEAMLADVQFVSMLEKRGGFRKQAVVLKTESLIQTQALIDLIDKELSRK